MMWARILSRVILEALTKLETTKQKRIFNPVFQAGFLLILFVVVYFVPFSSLFNTWTTNDDYSYGLLIPFIAGYLLWDRQYYYKEVPIKSCWTVFPLLLLFIALSVYGVLGSSGNISMPSLPILIILFSIFCFGKEFFKKAWLPISFLAFMVPLPAVLDRTVGVFLKTVSSELGGAFLQLIGYSVFVSGNVIDLGVTKLQVIDACSGLRFVFPLLALGVIYAYFFEKVAWKKVLCVLVTIPIAIVTNVLRIGIAGILTYQWGSEMAEGFFHDFQGWAIFMVAFIFLFIFGRLLRFIRPDHVTEERVPQAEDYPDIKKRNTGAFYTSIVLLIAVGVLTLNAGALPPVKIQGGIVGFPLSFAEWKGRAELVEPDIIDASGAEEAFNGMYLNKESEQVSLYMGYRSTAFLENENFFHSPTVCLPSSGWNVVKKNKYVIQNVPVFVNLPVTEMVIETMGIRQLVYFWFQTKDKVTHDKNINRFHLALHALKKDNTHDLFIRPIIIMKEGETLEQARKRLDAFSREMMATLVEFLNKNQIIES